MEALEEAGLDANEIAERGTRAILLMILEHGFFHADPHPGNIMYLPENRIGLLDFGMVGQLSEQRRHEVAALIYGLVSRDADTVVSLLVDWREDGQARDSRLGGGDSGCRDQE